MASRCLSASPATADNPTKAKHPYTFLALLTHPQCSSANAFSEYKEFERIFYVQIGRAKRYGAGFRAAKADFARVYFFLTRKVGGER